jgi:hypothetical protein
VPPANDFAIEHEDRSDRNAAFAQANARLFNCGVEESVDARCSQNAPVN